jgi:hypothetical protein
MSKFAHPIGEYMAEHIIELDVIGSLADTNGRPIELDLFLGDSSGRRFAINIMTLARYEHVKTEQPDIDQDPDAPHVFVVNEDSISLDSLVELLKSPDIRVFEPYLASLED